MKKYFLQFIILSVCLLQAVNVNASIFSLWEDEDEEAKMITPVSKRTDSSLRNSLATTTKIQQPKKSNSFFALWEDEDEENPVPKTSSTRNNNMVSKSSVNMTTQVQQPKTIPSGYSYQSPEVRQSEIMQQSFVLPNNTIATPNYLTNNNNDNYDFIDYDTIQAERRIQDSEVLNSIDKWQLGVKNVFWENYRGNNIRIEMLRNNRDLKEMRLKFVQSQDMIADPDGSISDMLNKVAHQVMKRTCGKKSKQSIILYERPSIELVKETTFDDYKVIARGTSLKEYGFRCIY